MGLWPVGPHAHSLDVMTHRDAAISHVRHRVDQALQAFLHRQREVLLGAGADLKPGIEAMAGLLAGGKRLRPAFCYWGWRGAGGDDCAGIFAAAAALELLHAGALVHDDLMDASDTRRGQPSLHRQFEAWHAAAGWRGSPQAFGMGSAILLGDLLLCWTDELFHGTGLSGAPVPPALLNGPGAHRAGRFPTEARSGGATPAATCSVEVTPCAPVAAAYAAYGLPL